MSSSSSSIARVDITGLNKVFLLHTMWCHSKTVTDYMEGWSADMADQAISKYVHSFQGRVIECDISQDTVDPGPYDSEHGGTGAFQCVVAIVRNRLERRRVARLTVVNQHDF